MIHIHWHNKVGHWTGYYGLSICRCGHTKLTDLYGAKYPLTEEQEIKTTRSLLIEAGRL